MDWAITRKIFLHKKKRQKNITKRTTQKTHMKKIEKQLLHDVTLKKEILAQKIARPGLKNIYWSIP